MTRCSICWVRPAARSRPPTRAASECNVWRSRRNSPRGRERPGSRRSVAGRHDDRVPETGPEIGLETGDAAADPDLLVGFRDVSLRRGGHVLVGPLGWAVGVAERWG